MNHSVARVREHANASRFVEPPEGEAGPSGDDTQIGSEEANAARHEGARELARQFPGDRFGSTIGRAGKELAPQGAAQKAQDRAGPLRTTAESLTPFLHESEIALAILRVVVRQEEDLALGEIADEVQNLAEGIVVEMADDRAFGMTKPVALSMEFCPDGDFQKEAVLILEPASAQELVAPGSRSPRRETCSSDPGR